MTQDFELGDILSITAGPLVSRQGMDGVYAILNYMTGENLYTHQLPRAAREARPALLRQHPQLAAVDASGVTPENWEAWLVEQEGAFGLKLPIEPLTPDEHEYREPLSELAEHIHPEKIIVVKAGQ